MNGISRIVLAAGLLGALAAGSAGCRTTPSLSGTTWVLQPYMMPGAPNFPPGAPRITMLMGENGRIAGCSGVNQYRATVHIDPRKNQFKLIGPPMVTRMVGPGLEFERYYLTRLSQVDSYRFEDNRLVLLSGGRPVIEFLPCDALPSSF